MEHGNRFLWTDALSYDAEKALVVNVVITGKLLKAVIFLLENNDFPVSHSRSPLFMAYKLILSYSICHTVLFFLTLHTITLSTSLH